MATSALEQLRMMLEQFSPGLGVLAPYAWYLYQSGITDPQTILLHLEGTTAFQQQFPGLIEAGISPGEYISYTRSVQSMFATAGLPMPSQAVIGNLVASHRSVAEVQQDLQLYTAIKQNPNIRIDFFSYTGIDPGPEGLLALTLGLAPDLESAYNRAVTEGVSHNEYFQRKIEISNKILDEQKRLGILGGELDKFALSGVVIDDKRLATLTGYGFAGGSATTVVRSNQISSIDQITTESLQKFLTDNANLDAQIATMRERVVGLQKSLATFTGSTNFRQWTQQQLDGLKSKISELESRKPYVTYAQSLISQRSINTLEGQLDTLAPPVLPNFDPGEASADPTEILRAFQRAAGDEQARFKAAGGSSEIANKPVVETV